MTVTRVQTDNVQDLAVTTGKIADAAVTLAKLANLAQDQFIGRVTGSTGVPETATITAVARTVLDDTTLAAMVNTLGGAASSGAGGLARLDTPTFTTPSLGSATATGLALSSGTVTNVPTPAAPTDAANKSYVDNLINGLKWKEPVRLATTGPVTLATGFESGDTIDGFTLVTTNRILIKDQADGTENGIYTVNASGAPTRALDADSNTELVSASVMVKEGTVNADKAFVVTNDTITLGATSIVFVNFNSTLTTISLTGDVTGSGSTSIAATIANDAVTLAKLANIATATLIGRGTAGTGDPESITLGAGLAFTGTVLNTTGTALTVANFVIEETPAGTINGTNPTFTLSSTPTAGTVKLYKNGLRMKSGGGNDYTISGLTITMLTGAIPITGDTLIADYMK